MRKAIKFIIPLILVLLTVQMLHADDEDSKGTPSYRLPQACMKYFLLAQKHRADTMGIVYSDSMRMEALRLNHKESYVISYLGAMYYHCSTYNIMMMEEAARKLREESTKIGDTRYYYASYTTLIDAHVERRAFSNAIQIGTQMLEECRERNDVYGQWAAYRKLSETYETMGNPISSREALLKAIEYWPKLQKKTSSTYLYCRLAKIEQSLPKRLEIIKEAERQAINYFDSAQVNTAMLRYYAEAHDGENYHALYKKVKAHPRFPSGYSQIHRVEFEAYDKLFSTGKEDALSYFTYNKELIERDYLTYMKLANLYANDFEGAYRWHEKEDSVHNSQQAEVLANDIYTFNTRLMAESVHEAVRDKEVQLELERQEKAVIEAERARVEAENARLTAERERAESERQKSLAENERQKAQVKLKEAEVENSKIRLEKEQQRLKRSEAERKAAEAEAATESAKSRLVMLTASIVMLLLVIIAVLYYARRQRLMREHIEGLNADLREAQEAAKRANDMKVVFMQNMSHEIRTPMNAIMGFSQILTSPGMTVSEEEKKEFGQHISDNVNMLHMLVEDMLNASDIETGRFVVSLQSTFR